MLGVAPLTSRSRQSAAGGANRRANERSLQILQCVRRLVLGDDALGYRRPRPVHPLDVQIRQRGSIGKVAFCDEHLICHRRNDWCDHGGKPCRRRRLRRTAHDHERTAARTATASTATCALFIFAVPISSPDRGQVELNEIKIKLGLIDSYNFRRSLENPYPPASWKKHPAAPRRPNVKDRARRKRKTPPAAAGGVKFSRLEQKLFKKS